MNKPGHFIVVEGLEGAGKSTALNTIKRFLLEQSISVVTTREPGGTHVGEVARQLLKQTQPQEPLDPRAELLLFYAARVQLIEQIIRPALQAGQWILADRFELSTFAYQGGGRQINSEILQQLSAFCVTDLKPNLIIFLDIQPQQGLQRAHKRGELDRIEQENIAFFNNVYQRYHQHLKTMKNVVIVDASQPLPRVQGILRTILKNYLHEQTISIAQ